MGNAGAILTFQCWENDARLFARFMQPEFENEDLMKLDAHQAALFMKFQKQQLPAFSLETEPVDLIRPDDPANPEERIRQLSIQQYTPMSHENVMKWLGEIYPRRRKRNRSRDDDGPPSDPPYGSWKAGDEDPDAPEEDL